MATGSGDVREKCKLQTTTPSKSSKLQVTGYSKFNPLCYHGTTMKYANVSVKFPEELDSELERFLEETGVYTNKSEFIKEAVRSHLQQLNDEPAIAALRVEQLLARAEREPVGDAELRDRLSELGQGVDEAALSRAVETARRETADEFADRT